MKKLGILVSGRGSNMMAIEHACKHGELSANIELVISNNKNSLALALAQEKNIKTACIDSSIYPDSDASDKAMVEALDEHDIDLVLLAGFMKKIGPRVLSRYKHKVINIHPSLLPKFGGKGMFGINIHTAVLAAGEIESGVTIHLVNGKYDEGAVLTQQTVSIASDETPESLAAKVLKVEHVLFSKTIQKIIDGIILLPSD
tara:strand:+ start:2282 stop:2884 length:603 start_codon:yes stop_codon:yes gene_type:complete